MPSRRLPNGVIAVLVVMLIVSACGDDTSETFTEIGADLTGLPAQDLEYAGDDAGFSAGDTADTTIPAGAPTEAPGDGADLGSGGIVPAVYQTEDLGRDIIFTADLTVAVSDVATAGDDATRAIQGLGGFLFGQRTTGSPEPQSVLTFKVFPEDFQEALDRLGSIGELRSQDVSADDVTERIVDLQSRISTAEASVARLRGLLETAGDIETITEIERELLDRETQLETLRGQLRTLQDQVALATIVLRLIEAATRPAVSLDVSAYPGHDGAGASCPGSSGLAVDVKGDVTVCFEITNVGDTRLTGFEVRDPVLNVENEDVILVFGDPQAMIEPGESIVLAAEIVAERNLRAQTTVTALPVAEDDTVLSGRSVANTATMFIEAVDPGGIRGFGDGVVASWNFLVDLARWLVLFAGYLLPFAWIPVLGWLWLRYRRREKEPPPAPAPAANPEPVPVAAEPATEAQSPTE